MEINPENTSTALGGVLGSILGITWLIKKGLTAWKPESLEAARVDSLSEVVNILTGQIKDLNQNADDLKALIPNSAPTVGSPKGWICTVAGTPGTWVSEGSL